MQFRKYIYYLRESFKKFDWIDAGGIVLHIVQNIVDSLSSHFLHCVRVQGRILSYWI